MFLDFWCGQTMRSRIEPMKKIARMLRAHRALLVNYFRAEKKFSAMLHLWSFKNAGSWDIHHPGRASLTIEGLPCSLSRKPVSQPQVNTRRASLRW